MLDLSHEIRRLPLSDPGPESIHIAVAYPNTYSVAMASLGFQTIHRIVQGHAGFVAHRVTLETAGGRDYPSRTLEEGLEIKSLAALLVSCSFELDYLHLVRLLDAAGIPPLRSERRSLPLIVLGGIALSANPEPLALFADAIVIGEGEETVPGLLDDLEAAFPLLQGRRFDVGLRELYEAWDQREGVYVPALWEDDSGAFTNPAVPGGRRVVQAFVHRMDDHPSYTHIVSPDGVYGAKNLVEISRGCPTGCRFCLLSYISPHGRDRTLADILKNARRFTPEDASIGLISSCVSDHPDLAAIIRTLAQDGYEVSVSSLKVSSTTCEILEALAQAGARSVTFAPEHGSARIRELIAKPYTYEDVRERVGWAFDAGMSRVKLYFLTGFEEETDDDLRATPEFILSLADDLDLSARPPECRLAIGLAPFVPKAATPFQRRAMDDEATLKRKIKSILGPLRGRARIDVEAESPRAAILQGALSQGDRNLAEHLAKMARSRGPLLATWGAACRECGDEPRQRVLHSRSSDRALPWSFIRRPDLG